MVEMCNNSFSVLNKSIIHILDDGRLFTENDGLAQIYDQGFCVDTNILGSSKQISALTCANVNPTKTCDKRNNVSLGTSPLQTCSREELDIQFRLVYTILGGISLVSRFRSEIDKGVILKCRIL